MSVSTSKARLAKMVVLSIIMSFVVVCSGTIRCHAAPGFNDAVTQYNAGHHSQALSIFQMYASAYPTNALCHYYMALCLQAMARPLQSRNEYQLAMQYGDQSIKNLSAVGLQRIGRLTSSSASSSRPIGRTLTSPPGTRAASQQHVKKILEFYTSWCSHCKEFEPTWDATRSRFPGIDFQRVDAEDPANAALVSQYNVRGYPTFVYLDGSGNVLSSHAGAPAGENGFARRIEGLSGIE